MSDTGDTGEDDRRILRSARGPITHVSLGPEGDRELFRRQRERQQRRTAREAEASRALASEAGATSAMATTTMSTSAQQTSQAGSSGTAGFTVAQTVSQSTGLMASQPAVLTPEDVAIQQTALQEAQLQQALGQIKREKEMMIRRRTRMQRRGADIEELESIDLTNMDDDVRKLEDFLKMVEERWHNPQEAQKATDAILTLYTRQFKSVREATDAVERLICVPGVRYDPQVLLTSYSPTTDGRKKTLPPNWKAKGRIMFVDNDGSTIELDDNFQEGVGAEAGGDTSEGGVVAVVTQQKGALITEYDLTDDVTRSLVEAYREDQFMSEIIRRLEAKDKQTSAEFELVNDLLFLEKEGNKRLCVPDKESLCSLFLGECHDATDHFGYKKTATNLLQRFRWPTMLKDAKLYVENCQVCQRDKPRTQASLGLLKPLPIPERPGESLSMDFMDTLVTSKSGMRQIFVIVDRFSKYARLIAMPETTKTEYVIRLFKENWVRDFGLPKSIVSDKDVRFTSELWKVAAAEQGTQLQMTSGNHPEANGQAEQMNRAVQHLLRHYIRPNQVDWDDKLAFVASLYNNVVHSATGVGDRVWVKSSKLRQEFGISRKLMPQYFGPWEVLDVVGTNPDGPSYVIRIPGHLITYPVFHAPKLVAFKETDQFPSRRSMLPPTMDGEVDIDDIVDHREMPVQKPPRWGRPPKPKLQFRVHFRHYTDPKEDRWFTREELMQTASQIVAHYEKDVLKGKPQMAQD
ncbi:hypothetical protein CBR_g30422 [Chara braunii]|uniref:Integrase catalytic domain-containing protein n=1 Tax=Chara braunii TaxID=69332 RepID=A0A388LCN8_CHABU|nr:hypothetical protein CBR_g30422 [Chara braunii]|eukprot:GBG80056.1 hypothetical protein CBR_g30422 [Chara braunii]